MDKFSMNDFIFDALVYGEQFTISELYRALGVETTEDRRRVSRKLAYLVSKGTLERLKRGEFKNLNPTQDISGKIGFIDIDHREDGQELLEAYNKCKKAMELSGHEIKRIALWNYEERTSVFWEVLKHRKLEGFILLISEDDPQVRRVIRYVSSKAEGSNLAIFFEGTKDLKLLFPGIDWF